MPCRSRSSLTGYTDLQKSRTNYTINYERPPNRRSFSVSKKVLASPFGRGGPRQRVGEGAGFSKKSQKYRIFARQIFDKPSQSCLRMTALPKGEPRRFAQNGFIDSPKDRQSGGLFQYQTNISSIADHQDLIDGFLRNRTVFVFQNREALGRKLRKLHGQTSNDKNCDHDSMAPQKRQEARQKSPNATKTAEDLDTNRRPVLPYSKPESPVPNATKLKFCCVGEMRQAVWPSDWVKRSL